MAWPFWPPDMLALGALALSWVTLGEAEQAASQKDALLKSGAQRRQGSKKTQRITGEVEWPSPSL